MRRLPLFLLPLLPGAGAAETSGPPTEGDGQGSLPVVEVIGRRQNLIGEAISASQGVVGAEEQRVRVHQQDERAIGHGAGAAGKLGRRCHRKRARASALGTRLRRFTHSDVV